MGIIIIFFTFSVFAENDPTMPPEWNPKTEITLVPENIKLTGIFTSDDQMTAIINTKSVKKGDFIEGYEVTKITDNVVYLKNNKGIFVVPLIPQVKSRHEAVPLPLT